MTEKERLYTALLVCCCRRGEREAMTELVGLWEQLIASMIIFEIMAGLQLLLAHIHKGEVTQQEKLLEIEYRIAELGDKFNQSQT